MSTSLQDALDRLKLMASARQTKWDLSPNDQEAIQAVLIAMGDRLARADLAERRLALAIERLRCTAEVGCYGKVFGRKNCRSDDKCSACRALVTLEQIGHWP